MGKFSETSRTYKCQCGKVLLKDGEQVSTCPLPRGKTCTGIVRIPKK